MKKILTKILVLTAILSSFAQTTLAVDIEKLIPKSGEKSANPDDFLKANENLTKYPEVGQVAKLPELTQTSLITEVIKLILTWSMLITLIAIVVAAIYYLISRGKEEDITKAKDILIYLMIGIAIMAAAYGVVVGITQFEFFDTAIE